MSPGAERSVAAVIPAAGQGGRMGGPKSLLRLEGKSLLEYLAGLLDGCGYFPVIAVCSEKVYSEYRFTLPTGAVLMPNSHPEKGMLYSIRLGLAALESCSPGVLVHPVDHPFVQTATLRKLREKGRRDMVLIPTFQGRRGHPPIFGCDLLTVLREIPLDEGARGVYRRLPEKVVELETDDEGVLLNANTPASWIAGLRLLRERNRLV